jgi:LacI family transcriptional regulator, galactose operon repressor
MASEPIARRTPPAVGMKDIAERLGVSIGTVDRALNGKPGINPNTCAHVLAVAQSLGYRPNLAARYLRARRPVRVSVHLPGRPSLFWDALREGIHEAAAPLAPSLAVEMLADPDVEDALLPQACAEDADGLIVADGSDPAVAAHVAGALGRGVPVACVGVDAPPDPRIISISTDPFDVGALAGELVGRFLPDGGQVAVVADSVTTRAHTGRVGGFVSSLSAVSPRSTLSAVVETHVEGREIRRRMREMLEAHPRLKAVCITAADALAVLRVLEQERPLAGIHVVVTDLAAELFDSIRRGAIAAAIYQRPFMQGRLALQLLHQQIQTRALPTGHRRSVAPFAVMRSNLDLVFERGHIAKTNAEELSDITHAGSDGGRDDRGAGSGRNPGNDGNGAGSGRAANGSGRHLARGRERSPRHLPPARA